METLKDKCAHSMYYWEHQYGKGNNIYVVRVCSKCNLFEKGKIGKFKKCTDKEIAAWGGLKKFNMNLSQIIERKKEELKKEYNKQTINYVAFLEKAIRESAEEALREVRPKGTGKDGDYIDGFIGCLSAYDSRVKEFMK